MSQIFYAPMDPAFIKIEKTKAKELRLTQWWNLKLQQGLCHYCGLKFEPSALTMDHVVPIGRGGRSTKSNVVPCCKSCNSQKGTLTPAEMILSRAVVPK